MDFPLLQPYFPKCWCKGTEEICERGTFSPGLWAWRCCLWAGWYGLSMCEGFFLIEENSVYFSKQIICLTALHLQHHPAGVWHSFYLFISNRIPSFAFSKHKPIPVTLFLKWCHSLWQDKSCFWLHVRDYVGVAHIRWVNFCMHFLSFCNSRKVNLMQFQFGYNKVELQIRNTCCKCCRHWVKPDLPRFPLNLHFLIWLSY